MRTLRALLATVIAFTALAAVAFSPACADMIVNDRTLDPPGRVNAEPTVARVASDPGGDQVIVLWWENQASTVSHLRFADSFAFFAGPAGFVQEGSPPVPTGYIWYNDPVVRAPNPGANFDGTFYIAGSMVSTGTPRHPAIGFVRGYASDPSTISFDPPHVISDFGPTVQTTVYTGILGMEVSPVSNEIYIVYLPDIVGGPLNDYELVTSADGATWSSPKPLGANPANIVANPRIVCGKNPLDVAFYWGESDVSNPLYPGPITIKCRTSADGGVTLGPITTVMTYPSGYQTDPGDISSIGSSFGSVFDRSGGTYDGTTLFGTGIPIDMSADVYPDPATAPSVREIEPNGSAATATPFGSVGTVLRGTLGSGAPADTDNFSINLSAGQAVSVNCDSTGLEITDILMSWIGPDGRAVLTTVANGGPNEQFAFTAPVDGHYVLRVTGFASLSDGYRIRTVTSSLPSSGALDQRDMAVSRLPSGGAWTGTQRMLPLDPIGTAQTGLTLGWNVDGALYASYNSYDVTPGTAISRRVIRRSADGGATWSAPASISSANTDWMQVYNSGSSRYFNEGQWCDMTSDGIGMYTVWTDGRNGDSDVYLSYINRRVGVTDVTAPMATGYPGDLVHVIRHVQNFDTAQPFDIIVSPSTPFVSTSLSSSNAHLDAGQTAAIDCAFTIPLSMAPGTTRLLIGYQSNLPPYSTYVDDFGSLTVLAPAGVGKGPAVLALEPVAPNPLRGQGTISYSLSREGPVELSVYGIDGRLVRSLASGTEAAGEHSAAWDARDVAGNAVGPGAYFVVMRAEGRSLTRRMVYLR